MLERRLRAYRHWLTLEHPKWAHLDIPEIDFQDVIYYAAPKPKKSLSSMDEVDPELKRTFDKLGIPLEEQMALVLLRCVHIWNNNILILCQYYE